MKFEHADMELAERVRILIVTFFQFGDFECLTEATEWIPV
jgi:hypothetical protein